MSADDIKKAVKVNMDEAADNDADFTDAQDSEELDDIIESKIDEAVLFILQNAREDLLDNALLSVESNTVSDKTDSTNWSDVEVGDIILWKNSNALYTSYVTTKGSSITTDTYVSQKGGTPIEVPTGSTFVKIVVDASYGPAASNTLAVQLNFEYARLISARLTSWRRAVRAEDFVYEGTDDELRVTDPVSGASYERPAVVMMFDGTETYNKKKLLFVGCKSATEIYNIVYIKMPTSRASSYSLGSKLERALINYITGLVWVTYNEKERAQEMLELAMTQIGVEFANNGNNS